MDYRLKNQNLISANIANANTPGYKAKELQFEDAIREALNLGGGLEMRTTDSKHIGGGSPFPEQPMVVEEANNVISLDGNTVDTNEEMIKMSENQLMYTAAADLMKRKMAGLKYAIQEGGR